MYEFRVFDRHVQLPMVGRVRLKERTITLQGRAVAATISRRADRWFVSLTVEREREIPRARRVVRPADIVGVDLGLANAAVTHDGVSSRVIEPQRALRQNLAKLRRLDRQLARKQKGSRNREKAKLRRARLHCGLSLDRDVNAAIDLRAYGLRELGIVPLPEDLRKVTPDGEGGSGASRIGAKPSSLKQEASGRRGARPNTQKRVERLADAGFKLGV